MTSVDVQEKITDKPSRAVVVLGMHRSGTSAMAGVLSYMGVDFGSQERLIGGRSEENAKGFWEHREIVMLNEQLLLAIGSSWDDVRDADVRKFESDEIRGIKEKIKAILRRDFSNVGLWGIKDPRICKLLPVWIDIFKEIDVAPLFILAYRHPEEVACSLGKRDGISHEKGYLLWLSYVLSSELFSRGGARTFVAYESLLGDWHIVMKKAFRDLAIPFDDHVINSNAINSFLSPELRHMVSGRKSLKRNKAEWVQKLYQGLRDYSDGLVDELKVRNGIDQLRRDVQVSMSLFVPMLFDQGAFFSEIKMLRKEYANLLAGYDRLKGSYEQTKGAYEQTKGAYEQTKGAYEQTKGAYEQTKGAYEQTKGAYEQTKGAYEQTKGAYEQTKGDLEATRDAYIQTKSAFEEKQEELSALKGKFSWRVCNKLGI